MEPSKVVNGPLRWRMFAYFSIALVLAWSTWFSVTAVIPQLNITWSLSPSNAAWMTIAVQAGVVINAVVSSLLNDADILKPRYRIVAGATGAAAANFLLLVGGGAGSWLGGIRADRWGRTI